MTRRRPKPNLTEHRMSVALDALAEFEAFQDDILPILRKAIKEGWTRDQIDQHPKVQALLAARQVTIALKDEDSSKALAAIKDIRDRTQGKAVERREVEHRYAKLSDDELDALLTSEAQSLEEDSH